ncbi:hypothetical protein HGT70_14420 [Rosenbergiella collisarenosi]|uniref:hypothetical protein n=1 Tax=Rosenbergiella collisarenosi TaxID=1544695 RepID=UPI001BDAEDFC|nr:hypothetical protein [Rosenbergiella collisarenosi]MBT0722469.1 hypothetical protein [Rosenbergiella collisarenosi]
MAGPDQKWVFTELVKDINKPEQLIAYALYKADKDDQARDCRRRGLTEVEINQELSRFHNQLVASQRRLQTYRDQANKAIDTFVTAVSENIEAKFKKQQADLEKGHKQELKSHGVEWLKKVNDFAETQNKQPWWKTLIKWLLSGIPGLLSTVIVAAIIVGAVGLFNGASRGVTKQAIMDAINTLIPDTPVVGVTDQTGYKDATKPH